MRNALTAAAIGVLLLVSGMLWAAPPSPETVREGARSVLRIVASACPGSNSERQGTGFLWPDSSQVVTALHVVADCGQVTAELTDPVVTRRATLTKLLKRADLALLTLASPLPAGSGAMAIAAREPRPQEDLVAISMPLNTPSWQDTYGKRSVAVTRLSELLDDNVRRRIQALGTPDVNLEIFRLTAVVKPGSSGGPVLNAAGEVVGVIDGGLDGGSSALNWATHARYLNELTRSQESAAGVGLGAQAAETFAYSIGRDVQVAGVGGSVNCGAQPLFLLARRTLEEVLVSVEDPQHLDDPMAFLQLVGNFSNYLTEAELASIAFDLYVNQASGSTVAVPVGFNLEPEGNGFCSASSPVKDVAMAFRVTPVDGFTTDAQTASLQFETEIARLLGVEGLCASDPIWTQLLPKTRWDGLISRRAGWNCLDAMTGNLGSYVFGTHLARGDSYTGVVAAHAEMQAFAYGNDRRAVIDWASAAIAAVISTYQL